MKRVHVLVLLMIQYNKLTTGFTTVIDDLEAEGMIGVVGPNGKYDLTHKAQIALANIFQGIK